MTGIIGVGEREFLGLLPWMRRITMPVALASKRAGALMPENEEDLRQAMGALHQKDLPKFKALLRFRPIEINQPWEGKFLLVEAVQAGAEFVQALLEVGAKADVQDKSNSTPLVKAAWLEGTCPY
jgi:hypothetical protein